MKRSRMPLSANLPARWRWLALLILCVVQAGRACAETPVRVAILPPAFEGFRAEDKRYSGSIADYLQGKLRDTPGVEWVERGDLDKLLAEVRPALGSGADLSPMVLGHLLKADVILSGNLDTGSHKIRNGVEEYTSGLELQVIDLTNASVLAQEKWDHSNDLDGVTLPFAVQMMKPEEVALAVMNLRGLTPKGLADVERLKSLGLEGLAREARKIGAAELEKTAGVARKLLDAGLAERRATAGSTTLVPIFFADLGADQSLAGWEDDWQSALREAAAARPGVRLLQFLGVEQARQEQKLALLGFTRADPAAWQDTADGYVWGSYQTVPGTQTTEAGDTEVVAEVSLRLGGDETTRFERHFKVKDSAEVLRSLARDVVAAAQGKHPRRSPEGSVKVARMIFDRLCTLVHGGFFQADPPLADTLPKTGLTMGVLAKNVLEPIERLPQPKGKLAYCRQLVNLACFFDPSDNRLELLRCALANAHDFDRKNPDQQLDPMAEAVELLERIAQARVFDAAAFITGVNATLSRLLEWQGGRGWSEDEGISVTETVPDPQISEQHDALLNVLLRLLLEKLPAVVESLDTAHVSTANRRFLEWWMSTILRSQVDPEYRLQYVAVARRLTPPEEDLTQAYEKLMVDLGDRKRVQQVLMQSEPPQPSPTPRLGQPGPSPLPATTPSALPVASVPGKTIESSLAALKPGEPPVVRRVELSLDRFAIRDDVAPRVGRTPAARLGLAVADGMSNDRRTLVERIDGFGDQLVLGVSAQSRLERRSGVNVHLLFQTSSEAVQVLPATTSEVVCGDDARVLYRQGDSAGWTDLLTSESGIFSPATGSPVGTPAALGFDGKGHAILADGGAKTVALYDWDRRGWSILPPPPAVPPPDHSSTLLAPAEVFGTGDALIFPLWNLVFDQAKQRWRPLPGDACLPLFAPPTSTDAPYPHYNPAMGRRFCVDGHLWSWNEHGIMEFSVAEDRVVWHEDALHLRGVCCDGPYLWLALVQEDPQHRPPNSTLILLNRRQHEVMGLVNLSFVRADNLHADDHQLWVGASFAPSAHPSLLCLNKAELYAALPGAVLPKATRPLRLVPGQTGPALYAALLGHNTETTRQLLDRGLSANTAFGESRTPALMVAAWTGSEALCGLLLGHGATPDALRPAEQKAWTALATAARQDNRTVVQTLLQAGAKPTESALTEALRNQDFEASAALIKAGAPSSSLATVLAERPNQEFARRISALHLPLAPADQAQIALLAGTNDERIPGLGDDPKVIAQLLRKATPEQADKILRQIPTEWLRRPELRGEFFNVVRRGSLAAVTTFLDAGVSPSAAPSEHTRGERGPLDLAFWHPDVFSLLLQRGADPRLSDVQEDTFGERVAGAKDGAAMLPALLEHYPALNTRHGYGTLGGSLLCAAATGWPHRGLLDVPSYVPILSTRTLQVLLDHGVSPDAPGREGFTALHGAFAVRSAPVVCWLAGADTNLRAPDLAGRTVFDAPYCTVGERNSFAEKLRSYVPQSDQEAKGQRRLLAEIAARGGYADLFDAVSRGDLAGVREKLQKGCSVVAPYAVYDDPESGFSRQPGLVFLAVKNGERELVHLLLEHGSDANIGEAGCDFYAGNESPLTHTAQPSTRNVPPSPKHGCLTPLIAAAEAGDLSVVEMLLDHGAYAPTADRFLRNAVDAAATPELAAHIGQRARAQFAAEKLLVALGLRLSGAPDEQTVRKILAETPEALITPTAGDITPLSSAMAWVGMQQALWVEWPSFLMSTDAIKRLEFLHQIGVKLNGLDAYGTTALHRAVVYGKTQDVAALIKMGFDPRLPDRRGITSVDLVEGILDLKQRQEVLAALTSY